MHDCRKTKEDLLDLVFNEMGAEEELRTLEELERCPGCREEYRSMTEALRVADEAAASEMPQGEYWTKYRASLDQRLNATESAGETNVIPLWRRAASASFNVPVPLALAASLVLAVTTLLAVRSLIRPASQGAQQATTAAPPAPQIQFVEVPVEKTVIVEKVVPRTVYVERRGRESARRAPAPSLQNLTDMTAARTRNEAGDASRAKLNGFQPPSDVRLTVIKGSYKDEK